MKGRLRDGADAIAGAIHPRQLRCVELRWSAIRQQARLGRCERAASASGRLISLKRSGGTARRSTVANSGRSAVP